MLARDRPPVVASLGITQLLQRLLPQYDQTYAAQVMGGAATWPGGSFGNRLAHVQTLVAHLTAGWPRRDGADTFVAQYIVPGTPKRGIGPQFYISGDGTVAKLIDLPRRTGHGEWINSWAIGVETGNLGDVAAPPTVQWEAASNAAEDAPGLKMWVTSRRPIQTEVLSTWWTTATYAGPGRGAIGADNMIFPEQVMQAWALLARYLLVELELPRNFPLLPHEQRSGMIDGAAAAAKFRRTVLADERAEMVQRTVAAAPVNIPAVNFDAANAGALSTSYHAAIQPTTVGTIQRNNRAWRAWCETYRGLHGHGYAGSLLYDPPQPPHPPHAHSEHDCPGPLFDFHRLAREVSDYWWYPFDVAGGTTAVPRRAYRRFQADTPLIEHYFDETEADRTARFSTGIHGALSSPDTFTLAPASPVYAMSNGELVAARFPAPGAGVSPAFTLVRHEIYHAQMFPSVVFMGEQLFPETIDYGQAPESVYTLYMHLGRPAGMSFEDITDDNPDWLNRLLLRRKESTLGVAFYDGDPAHHGIAAGVWNNRPPGVPQRSTTLEGWRTDANVLDAFMTALSGGVAAFLPREGLSVSPRILLGDFLGESGVIRNAGGNVLHGVRVETFSRSFLAPSFSVIGSTGGWNPAPTLPLPQCVQYASEWARGHTAAERASLVAVGADPDDFPWWPLVVLAQHVDGTLPGADRLPLDGITFHYRPVDFAKWLNGVTWASEWPKYEVTDAAGTSVPRPARPRSRRV